MDSLELSMEGYIEYARQQRISAGDVKGVFKSLFGKTEIYTQEQLQEIDAHRREILERYRNPYAITRQEIEWAANNYKNLNEPQIIDILTRYGETAMRSADGLDFNRNATLFSLTTFPGVIIDYEDVFAIGLVSNVKVNKRNTRTDTVVCVMFTNDPYIPVFPIWYRYDLKLNEMMYSQQARIDIANAYQAVCPNLTYPITEVKELKKIIAQEPNIKGNISKEQMEKYLTDADYCSGIFDTSEYECYVNYSVEDLLESYGYVRGPVAEKTLGMGSKSTRDFWMFHIDNISKRVKGKQ
ncbi:MAG: hypothetical protein IJ397_05645 [Lachnospiraceae bacterium]|nr:hypothetical protein [Lachnospiraceae bacterium]